MHFHPPPENRRQAALAIPARMMRFSSNVLSGLGIIKGIGRDLHELKIPKNIIMLCGNSSFRVGGKAVRDALDSYGFDVEVISDGIRPAVAEADALVESMKRRGKKKMALLGVGGGGTLDVSKYVASRLGMPLIAVPTLLSSDAIATGYSVLWSDRKNSAVASMVPSVIIGDYEVLKNEPKRFVSSGAGDMLSKYSALNDWRLSFWLGGEPYSDFAMNIAQSTTELLKRRISDVAAMNYIGIETLFLAEITDGYLMELSGTTRVAAGSEHLFAFALETLTESALHGELCGLGTIMMTYLQSRERGEVKSLLKSVGAPTSAEEAGVKPAEVVKALTMAHRMRNWYTVLGANGLSEGAAERLARYTGIT